MSDHSTLPPLNKRMRREVDPLGTESASAPVDLRHAHRADPLNGEVIVMDVSVPPGTIDLRGFAFDQVKQRFIEAMVMRDNQGERALCVQIHVHYPQAEDEFISHALP